MTTISSFMQCWALTQDFMLAKQPLYQLSLTQVSSLTPVSGCDPVSWPEVPLSFRVAAWEDEEGGTTIWCG